MPDYTVIVEDNYHFPSANERPERRIIGTFSDCASAVAACIRIVDNFLEEHATENSARKLWAGYQQYGDAPWIKNSDSQSTFSTWTFAEQCCKELAEKRGENWLAETAFESIEKLNQAAAFSEERLQTVLGVKLQHDEHQSDGALEVYTQASESELWRAVEFRLSATGKSRGLLMLTPKSNFIPGDFVAQRFGKDYSVNPPTPHGPSPVYYEYRVTYGVMRFCFPDFKDDYYVDAIVLDRF